MNARALAIVIYFVINFKSCQTEKYSNYCLITLNPNTRDQLRYLRSLETQKYMDIMFWEKPNKIGQPVQLLVSPVDIAMFKERAEHFSLDFKVLIDDIQSAFSNQTTKSYQNLRTETFSFEHFHVLEDIYQWLTDLDLNKNLSVRYISIGKSVEGRDISMVNVNFDSNGQKEKVIVEGGIHGHEWASVVFVTYLIKELAYAEDSTDYEWKNLAKNYDWYLIPVVNPDGYAYTHKQNRLWRRNRSGVDLNRNFDGSFGKFGAVPDPNSEYFCGPKPFSEPETKVLSTFIRPMQKELKYYFAIHAYGQRIIIPYEDRIPHLENFGEMVQLPAMTSYSTKAAIISESYSRQAIRKVYLRSRVKYATGTVYDTMGVRMSGTSTSWVKKQMRVKYVYTIQVRDNGTYGYALPCDQLLPMCTETKMIIQELMTAKPRYVRALFTDGASVNMLCPLLILFVLFIIISLK